MMRVQENTQWRTGQSSRLLAIACFTLTLMAGAVPAAKPEDVGMSTDRLLRVREAVQRHLDAGALPGAVTLVARNGKIVHFEAHGLIDVEAKRPMPKDGVFRLASMSKPITAVAVMMLIEEGKVRLTDQVSRFIPEFKSAKVAIAKPAAASSAVAPPVTAAPGAPAAGPGAGPGAPAAGRGGGRGGRGGPPVELEVVNASRDITVRDLLTHTSGLMTSNGPVNGASLAGTASHARRQRHAGHLHPAAWRRSARLPARYALAV